MKRVTNDDDAMTPKNWFIAEKGAELVARRSEVWALLGWYHKTQVEPHLTVRGALRRLWWRVSGQKLRLLSPWDQIAARVQQAKAERAVLHEMANPR